MLSTTLLADATPLDATINGRGKTNFVNLTRLSSFEPRFKVLGPAENWYLLASGARFRAAANATMAAL
jgi:hypothetical protein